MFAEIIPIIRLPPKIKTFSYLIPKELREQIKIGQAVEIPFRNKNIMGIVLELKPTLSKVYPKPSQRKEEKKLSPKIKLKPIIKIFDLIPLLGPQQLKLVQWLADFYRVSTGLILKTILPPLPKKKFKINKIEKNKLYKNKLDKLELTSDQEKIIKDLEKGKNKIFLLESWRDSDKNNIYFEITRHILNQEKQVLIIVPEIYDLNQLLALFQRYFSNNLIAVLHSKLAKNQYFNTWQRIKNNQVKIIIGTRLAIFAPVRNLELIIIDKEHDSSHKQWDQNPRYHVREVALKLVELTGTKLLFSSPTPTLESFYQTQNKNYQLLKLKQEKMVEIKLIDMREEVRRKNFSPFSETLQDAIRETLKNKKQVFLFINRRGTATTVICNDCGYIFRCPNCHLPLVYHSNQFLKCHHCNFKMELPLFCPKCHGPELKFIGTGTQRIENEIKKLNSDIKIIRIDTDAEIKKCIEQKNCSIGFDLIIGTQMALKFVDWERIGLVGIISADNFLYLPDFRATEKTYELFSLIIYRLSEKSPTSKIIIQTRKSENYALQALVKNDANLFYNQELEERKDFNYPPFTRLIKLIFQHKNEKKCIYESRRLWRELNKKIEKFKGVEMSLPQPVYTIKVRGRYRYQIILKIPLTSYQLLITNYQLLNFVPDHWIIDIDPESLL